MVFQLTSSWASPAPNAAGNPDSGYEAVADAGFRHDAHGLRRDLLDLSGLINIHNSTKIES
jgi:hypothetical protein